MYYIYLSIIADSPLFKARRRVGGGGNEQQQYSNHNQKNDYNNNMIMQQQQPEEESTLSLGIPMLTQQQIQQQQEIAVMEQDRYIEHRSTAIESIESTIAELGGIFQQLATMVAEQRETVQRYVCVFFKKNFYDYIHV